MAFTPMAAYNAKVRIGGGAVVVYARKWTVQHEADELNVATFESAGYDDVTTGLQRLIITLELALDGDGATVNPWDSTIGLAVGTTVSTLKLYLNGTSGPYWDVPSARVISCSNPSDVKGLLEGTWTLKSKGTFTDPTGDLTP